MVWYDMCTKNCKSAGMNIDYEASSVEYRYSDTTKVKERYHYITGIDVTRIN